MRRKLRVLPEAESEILAAATWYEGKRPGLGVEFVAVLDRAFEEALDSPEAYPMWRQDRPYRRCALRRFPYLVFFTSDDDTVEIVAVAHAKRRPGYWIGREA